MKLVSLILPCYNHEKYIDDCLNSLCEQTYPHMEILLTDDCSRDNSYQVLQSWQSRLEERFCRVIIRKNPENQGVVRTLNGMLEACEGEYIKVLATDDMLLPDAIEQLVATAEETDSDIVFSNVYHLPEHMHYPVEKPEKLEKRDHQPPCWGDDLTGALLARNFICAPSVLMPRRTVEKFGLYDPAYIMEDFEYWLRVSLSGKFSYLDRCVALYRMNQNSLSHFSVNEAQLRKHRVFYEQTLAIFSRYEQYAQPSQKAVFFNRELSTAIGLADKELCKTIPAQMKQRGLSVSLWNRVRIWLVRTNIYLWLKKCKSLLKGR